MNSNNQSTKTVATAVMIMMVMVMKKMVMIIIMMMISQLDIRDELVSPNIATTAFYVCFLPPSIRKSGVYSAPSSTEKQVKWSRVADFSLAFHLPPSCYSSDSPGPSRRPLWLSLVLSVIASCYSYSPLSAYELAGNVQTTRLISVLKWMPTVARVYGDDSRIFMLAPDSQRERGKTAKELLMNGDEVGELE